VAGACVPSKTQSVEISTTWAPASLAASTRFALPRRSTSAIVAVFSPATAREIELTVVITIRAPATPRRSESGSRKSPRTTSAPSASSVEASVWGRTSARRRSSRARSRSAIRPPSAPVPPARKITCGTYPSATRARNAESHRL
jgi:hypothetical protein